MDFTLFDSLYDFSLSTDPLTGDVWDTDASTSLLDVPLSTVPPVSTSPSAMLPPPSLKRPRAEEMATSPTKRLRTERPTGRPSREAACSFCGKNRGARFYVALGPAATDEVTVGCMSCINKKHLSSGIIR